MIVLKLLALVLTHFPPVVTPGHYGHVSYGTHYTLNACATTCTECVISVALLSLHFRYLSVHPSLSPPDACFSSACLCCASHPKTADTGIKLQLLTLKATNIIYIYIYIYMCVCVCVCVCVAPILDVSRSRTTTHHSR